LVKAQQIVGEWHQPADLPGQPNLLEEGDEADQTAEGRDGFRGGSEPDLPSGEDRIARTLHRLVKGCGVRLFDTTLLPHGL
jgi:hypothetical protein